MARESVQKKLQRVRPPRVQVTYDVEIGDAIQLKELPFVLGVLGDFTGMPAEQLATAEGSPLRGSDRRQFRQRSREHEAARGICRRKQAQRRSRCRAAQS